MSNVKLLPDAEYFDLVRELLEVSAKIKIENEMRRLASNDERTDANKRDLKTNLVIEEVNEQAQLPIDYEPVLPELPPDEVEPGEDETP